MAWTNIYPITASDPVVRYHWTKAIINNELYLYRQDQDKVLKFNVDIPSVPAFDELEPLLGPGVPVNMAGVQGIFNARGRLGLWDIENSIYWSNPDDKTDFFPSPETGANVIKVDSLRGRIVDIRDTDDGFIVYATGNIVFGTWDKDLIFRFQELTNKVGVFSPDHICVGHNGEHIIYGNGEFYRVNANRVATQSLIENIFVEVSDYIKKYKGYPRLTFHGNRYLAISLNDKDGKSYTFAERNRELGPGFYLPGYFNQTSGRAFPDYNIEYWLRANNENLPEEYIDNQSLLGGICPEIVVQPPDDYYPIDYTDPITTGQVPLKEAGAKGKFLWGMKFDRRPGVTLERVSDVFNLLVPNQAESIYSYGLVSDYQASVVAEASFDSHAEFQGNNGFNFQDSRTTFSFNPFRLLSMQMYYYKERYSENFSGADNFGDISFTLRGYRYDRIGGDTEIHTSVIGEATGDISSYSSSATVSGDDNQFLTVISIREYDSEGNRVRDTFTHLLEKRKVLIQKVDANEFFEFDSSETPAAAGTSAFGSLSWLENGPNRQRTDSTFKKNAAVGASNFNKLPISSLGGPHPDGDIDLFATQANIAGSTDQRNYGWIGSFAARRAYVFSQTPNLDIYLQHEFVEEENEETPTLNAYYYEQVRLEYSWVHDFDILVLESLNNSPSGYADLGLSDVPKRSSNLTLPVWYIYNEDNEDPEPFLTQYWQEALINYPNLVDYNAIKQVYEDHGWTVVAVEPEFVPDYNVDQTLPVVGSDPSPDNFKDIPDSGVFTEMDRLGTICGEPLDNIQVVNFDPDDEELFNVSGRLSSQSQDFSQSFSTEQWEIEGIPLVSLQGQAGVLATYPKYSTTLWYDWLLKKWGICNYPVRFNLDYRPLNRISYDSSSGDSISEYTYENFLKSLGALGEQGELIVWDRNPLWSFVVFGKLGFARRDVSRIVEAYFEFAEEPNCVVGLETASTKKLINPGLVKAKYAFRGSEQLLCDTQGYYHTLFVLGGRYEIIQVEYVGHKAGER